MSITMRRNPAIQRLRPLRILNGSSDQDLARFDQLTYEFVAPAGEVLISEGKTPRAASSSS